MLGIMAQIHLFNGMIRKKHSTKQPKILEKQDIILTLSVLVIQQPVLQFVQEEV